MLNMVFVFLLLLLRLQLVSEYPSSPSFIYSPAYLDSVTGSLLYMGHITVSKLISKLSLNCCYSRNIISLELRANTCARETLLISKKWSFIVKLDRQK